MGVEYERLLIAKTSSFLPSTAAVAKLVERLRKEGWIPSPSDAAFSRLRYDGTQEALAARSGGYAVHTVANEYGEDVAAKAAASSESLPANLTSDWLDDPEREEIRLVWPIRAEPPLPVRYPLTRTPEGPLRYAFEIHRCHEYVYPVADCIEPVASTCACGDDLAFHWDDEEVVPAFGTSAGIFHECEACSRTFDPAKAAATLTNPFNGTKERVQGGAAYRFAVKIDCGTCFTDGARVAFEPDLVALIEDEFGRNFGEVAAVR